VDHAQQEAMSKWLPIETAPKDGTTVWAWSPTHGAFVAVYINLEWRTTEGKWRRPTAWMPLAEMPVTP
jgi:hypothetical protein